MTRIGSTISSIYLKTGYFIRKKILKVLFCQMRKKEYANYLPTERPVDKKFSVLLKYQWVSINELKKHTNNVVNRTQNKRNMRKPGPPFVNDTHR